MFAPVSFVNESECRGFRLVSLMRRILTLVCEKQCSLSRFVVVDPYPCQAATATETEVCVATSFFLQHAQHRVTHDPDAGIAAPSGRRARAT